MKTFYFLLLLLITLAGNIVAQGVVSFNYVWTGGGNTYIGSANFEGVDNNFAFRYNQLEGNLSLSDLSYTAHDLSFLDNTLIGNATLDKHSTSSFYEGGNTFTGTSALNIHSSAAIFIGSPASTYGDLNISRDMPGGTEVFYGSGAVINGNFSFQSPEPTMASLSATTRRQPPYKVN